MRRWTVAGAAAILAVACSSATETEATFDAAFFAAPVEVVLRVGQETVVPGTVLRVTFVGVLEDSRCPVGVTCVWEGNAEAEVGLAMGMGPTVPVRINTSLDPTQPEWNELRLTIVELLPQPRVDDPPRPDGYTLRLRIEAIG
jgi:hypothetical protein